MKNVFEKAKNEYNAIEIPSELNDFIESALNEERKYRNCARTLGYRYISIAACVFLCVVIGAVYLTTSPNGSDTDGSKPETCSTETERVIDFKFAYDTAVEEARASEKNSKAGAGVNNGEITELYSDDEVFSYSAMVPATNIISYHNVCRLNGEEIKIESLLGEDSEFNSSNSVFYFKSKDELVVISNGLENYIKLK